MAKLRVGLAAVAAAVLASCGVEQDQTQVAPGVERPASTLFAAADIDAAVAYLGAHGSDYRKGWSRAIVLASGTNATGSWIGAVVYPSGTVQALQGDGFGNGALASLLTAGDSIRLRPFYGGLSLSDVQLVGKGAVLVGP